MNAEGPGLSPRSHGRSRISRVLFVFSGLALLLGGAFSWSLYQEMKALVPLAQTFNCTIYYTPIEAAFSKGKGFNLSPETRPGLEGIDYPADFLKAVALEGFGRLAKPVKGRGYIYFNGNWGYAEAPVGNRSNPLLPKLSCAISTRRGKFLSGDWVLLRSKELPLRIESRPWRVDDVGAGVGENQIDLYWGEDAPLGPGGDLERPTGIDMTRVRNIRICLLPPETKLRKFWTALHDSNLPALAMHGLNPMVDKAIKSPSRSAAKVK